MSEKPFPDIGQLINGGQMPQATVRIQARQMLALERIADTLEKVLIYFQHPTSGVDTEAIITDAPSTPVTPQTDALSVGPATEHQDAGTPRLRRRRSEGI